jgi:NAD(P)-dependent dehydrogenase (short-subunit alcohol dehydrogenase family)
MDVAAAQIVSRDGSSVTATKRRIVMKRTPVDVAGKVVLVSGASAGIGRSTALAFDRAGARVALAARRAERLVEISAAMSDSFVVPTDVSDRAQVDAMVDRTIAHYGRLDVLVNNAGITRIERSDTMDVDACQRMFETNTLGPMAAVRRALPQMLRQGGGHIVNVSSPGTAVGVPMNAAYCATKAAMTGWTRTLQAEWAGTDIVVTEYNPGRVATEIGVAAVVNVDADWLGQDVSAVDRPNLVNKMISRLLSPDLVGEQIVDCVRRRRQTVYSGRNQTIGNHLIEIPSVRRAVGAQLGRQMRQRMKIGIWSDELSLGAPA